MGVVLTIFITIIIALVIYVIWATGALHKVEVQKTIFPETRIAYVTYIGDYSQAFKQTSIVEQAIKEKYNTDWSRKPCFGLYYDDPGKTDKEKCRSVVGKFIPDNFTEKEAPAGITFDVIPRIEPILQIEYPLRSILSIFAGIARAYPAINNYTENNNTKIKTAMLEVYGYKSSEILFAGSSNEGTGLWKEFPKDKNE